MPNLRDFIAFFGILLLIGVVITSFALGISILTTGFWIILVPLALISSLMISYGISETKQNR